MNTDTLRALLGRIDAANEEAGKITEARDQLRAELDSIADDGKAFFSVKQLRAMLPRLGAGKEEPWNAEDRAALATAEPMLSPGEADQMLPGGPGIPRTRLEPGIAQEPAANSLPPEDALLEPPPSLDRRGKRSAAQ